MLRNYSLFLAIGASLALFVSNAPGSTLNLSDQNSTVTLDVSSSAGLSSWTVNGTNYANQQWFWYSVDGGAPVSIDTLSSAVATNPSPDSGKVTYSGSNGLIVQLKYYLTGGSTNTQSDLDESIKLMNSGSAGHTYKFYEYSNFNLSQSGSDTVQFMNANTVAQTGGLVGMQTVATGAPLNWEGGPASATLSSVLGGSLSNTPNLVTSGGTSTAPGNVGWAYEWTSMLPAGGVYMISEDQQINPATPVPEPSSAVLLFACFGAALMTGRTWHRRRRAS